jgi:hypothetical protein
LSSRSGRGVYHFVILSEASAPLFFPPQQLRRADAQSKDLLFVRSGMPLVLSPETLS